MIKLVIVLSIIILVKKRIINSMYMSGINVLTLLKNTFSFIDTDLDTRALPFTALSLIQYLHTHMRNQVMCVSRPRLPAL